jgi:hypothetical protein
MKDTMLPEAEVIQYSTPEGPRYQLVMDGCIVRAGFLFATSAIIFAFERKIDVKPIL